MKLGTQIKRIISADAEAFRVRLEYTDGFKGTADLSGIFGAPRGKPLVTEILRGNLFEKCFVLSGALAWPNGYELCPDAIRQLIRKRDGRAA